MMATVTVKVTIRNRRRWVFPAARILAVVCRHLPESVQERIVAWLWSCVRLEMRVGRSGAWQPLKLPPFRGAA